MKKKQANSTYFFHKDYFKLMFKYLKKNILIYLAYKNNKLCGGLIGFKYEDFIHVHLSANNNLGFSILRHIVLGAEFLIHKNASILFGYNNRRRFEMIIEDRKALVGFSCGVSFKIKRFLFIFHNSVKHIVEISLKMFQKIIHINQCSL